MNTIQFARIVEANTIDIIINGNDIPKDFILSDLTNKYIRFTPLGTHHQNGLFHLIIKSEQPLNLQHAPFLIHRQKRFYLYPSINFLNKYFYSELPLGVILQKDKTIFRLWSPTASQVNLTLYTPDGEYIYTYSLKSTTNGIWETSVIHQHISLNSLHNFRYQYTVTAHGKSYQIIDPYALGLDMQTPYPHYSIIIDLNKVEISHTPLSNKEIINTPNEFVAIEANIRDYSIHQSSPVIDKHKGTFLGFADLVTHFKKLNISHIQLMPIHKCHTVNEFQREYQDENTPQAELNYNWGYDPLHFFTLEGRYSTDPSNPITRITEFKQLVKNYQQNNIGIIVDVVFNHIYDQRTLELVAPGCYLRRTEWGDISFHTGAGATIESRIKMTRRLMIDSLKYLSDFFGINGFRFDLLSFIDHQTIIEIRNSLGQDVILYGEGWDFTDLPKEEAITKFNYPPEADIALFNDSARDSIIGHITTTGIIQGDFNQHLKVKSAILGGIKNYPHDYNNDGRPDIILGNDPYNYFAQEPQHCINYLDIHDGFTLWDKLTLTTKDKDKKYQLRLAKQAFSLLLSTQGKIVLHGGIEFLRSKPVKKNDPVPTRSQHGLHENSYASCDDTNAIQWNSSHYDADFFNFVCQMIHLRRKLYAIHYSSAEEIKHNLRFIERRPPAARHNIKSFKELPSLTINFKNGPCNTSYYLAGEIHPANNSNPCNNPYCIHFNEQGEASIKFKRDEIQQFAIGSWGYHHDLQFKLIKTPGEWDYLKSAYTALGYNLLSLYSLNEKYEATIDLAYKDYHAVLEFLTDPTILAYALKAQSRTYLIVHNLSNKNRYIKIEGKRRTPIIKNIFTQTIFENPFRIKEHRSLLLQIDHEIEELFIDIPSA